MIRLDREVMIRGTGSVKREILSTDSLMHALSNDEFEPYLQPVVSASDFTISGAELLVRWHMPTGEIILPAFFMNRVESVGLLLPLTEKY